MVELSAFKTVLFQLNLSVHTLLAEVSTCSALPRSRGGGVADTPDPAPPCGQLEQARELQGRVVQLYSLWDNTHHRLAGGLVHTQVQ